MGPATGQAREQPPAAQAQDPGKANSPDAIRKTTAPEVERQAKSRNHPADKDGDAD